MRNCFDSRQKNFDSDNASLYSVGWDRLDCLVLIREGMVKSASSVSPQHMLSCMVCVCVCFGCEMENEIGWFGVIRNWSTNT